MNEIQQNINQIQSISEKAIEMAITYGPRIITSLLILLIGLRLIKYALKMFDRTADQRNLDPSLKSFAAGLIGMVCRVMLVLVVAGQIGIETTSFIAIFSAASLAVGFALQGTLSNFAGSVLVLLFKPYKVGDLVEIEKRVGEVIEIQILNTILISQNKQTIMIPNGLVAKSVITKYSKKDNRKIDLVIPVSYGTSFQTAKQTLLDICQNHPKILQGKPPLVGVQKFNENYIELTAHPSVLNEDYDQVFFELMEQVKIAFEKGLLETPNQTDVIKIMKG